MQEFNVDAHPAKSSRELLTLHNSAGSNNASVSLVLEIEPAQCFFRIAGARAKREQDR